MRHLLITGATGVVGSSLVPPFLAEPDTRLTLLIRAPDEAALAQRIGSLLAYWGNEVAPDSIGRVNVVRGDVAAERLGLSSSTYDALVREVTGIAHCAARVRLDMTAMEANESCLVPTQQIIAFAETALAKGRLRKLEYVGTLGVAGRMSGIVSETTLSPPGYFTEYERAKAQAEALVATAIGRGLPATIYRPSMVVGQARTGKALRPQGFHFLCRFLSGEFTRGLLPDIRGQHLDVVPSDWVARAIYHSSSAEETAGRILHLCAGPAGTIGLGELAGAVVAFRRGRGEPAATPIFIPPRLFLALAAALRVVGTAKTRRRLDQLDGFKPYLGHRQHFANKTTLSLLARAGCSAPPAVREFLLAVLGYFAGGESGPTGNEASRSALSSRDVRSLSLSRTGLRE